MHNTATTSVEAYRTLDTAGLRAAVLGYMRLIAPESTCLVDTAAAIQRECSTVSGEFNRLKNEGLIEYDGKRPSRRTGRNAMHWKVPLQPTLL